MKIILLFFVLGLHLIANEIEVTIIYGNGSLHKIVQTTYEENKTTALELIQNVSDVKVHKNGKFTFVRSIDGVESQIGKYGWFYLIDGQSVHKMAENYVLKNATTMTWYYGVEACH